MWACIDTPAITEEQIQKAERIVNDLIRQGKEVSVKVYNENTSEEELKDVPTRIWPFEVFSINSKVILVSQRSGLAGRPQR